MANRSRRINKLGLAAAAAIVLIIATALSSLAATKVFHWTVSGGPFAAGSTGDVVKVVVTNDTPSATINSFWVQVPTALSVQSAAPASSSSNPNASATFTTSGQNVYVQFLDPIKKGQHADVNITVNVAATGWSCGDNSVPWTADKVVAYTGSNLTGNTFAINPPNPTATPPIPPSGGTTAITKTCSLSFTVQPSDVGKDTPISPAVEVTLSEAVSGVNVTISKASGPGALSGTLTATTDGGVASFDNLKLDTAGTYTLQASAPGYGTATSNSFKVFESSFSGTNGCTASGSGGGTNVNITANGGSNCEGIPYTLTETADTVNFDKDASSTDQFSVMIAWGKPVPSDDPQSANTSITVGTTTYTHDQIPACPNNGAGYPAVGATPPWCISSYSWDGTTLTQTFHGTGDPSFTRTK